jgi:hypothetical protein
VEAAPPQTIEARGHIGVDDAALVHAPLEIRTPHPRWRQTSN